MQNKKMLFDALAIICFLLFLGQIHGCYKGFVWTKSSHRAKTENISIVSRSPKNGYHRNSVVYLIKYTFDVKGKVYNGRGRIGLSRQEDNIYQQWDVVYDPKNPMQNKLNRDRANLNILKFFAAIGTIMIALAFKGAAIEEADRFG